jgi:hypothetical protein
MQRIVVRVKPQSKKNSVEKEGDLFVVRTTAPAREGKANGAVIKLLADYFGIAPSRVTLARGVAMKEKVFEIDD